MKAMILQPVCNRLKPMTDNTPKALIPINGRPMLEHVIWSWRMQGFIRSLSTFTTLGDQIIDFLATNNNFGVQIHISDERDYLLDTGGGIKSGQFLQETNRFWYTMSTSCRMWIWKVIRLPSETNPVATLLVSNVTHRVISCSTKRAGCADGEIMKPEK